MSQSDLIFTLFSLTFAFVLGFFFKLHLLIGSLFHQSLDCDDLVCKDDNVKPHSLEEHSSRDGA